MTTEHNNGMVGAAPTGYWGQIPNNVAGSGSSLYNSAYWLHSSTGWYQVAGIRISQASNPYYKYNGAIVALVQVPQNQASYTYQWYGNVGSDVSALPMPPIPGVPAGGVYSPQIPYAPVTPIVGGRKAGMAGAPEMLAIDSNLTRGIGAIFEPQGLGACTPVTMDIDTARTNLETLMSGTSVTCNLTPGTNAYTTSGAVYQQACDFQAAYQAAASGLNLPLMPPNTQGTAVDGEIGPATIAALNNYLATIPTGYSWACNGNVMAMVNTAPQQTTPTAPTTPVTPVTPPPVVIPVTPPTITASNMSGLAIAGVALAGGLAAYWYLNKNKKSGTVHHTAKRRR